MSDPTFMADPTRLVIAAIVGIALLLALIIKLCSSFCKKK